MSEDAIERMAKFLAGSSIRFELIADLSLHPHPLKRIQVEDGDLIATLVVYDEYGDAELDSRLVRLHLVLDACVCFEEAADFSEWRVDLGLPDEPGMRAVYLQLSECTPRIRQLVGPLEPVRGWDIEFNTGVAQRMRAWREPVSD